VTKLFRLPVGNEDIWFDIAIKEFDVNTKVYYALLQALNEMA